MKINKKKMEKVLKEKGLSFAELCIRINCSKTHMSRVVNNRQRLTQQFYLRLVQALKSYEFTDQ